jgi:glycosyltransferase involved in cell wall biosynthesis
VPRLSIVIPSYNAAATIESCLGALLPQCDESTAEIIVVDSGDDDTARRVAEGFPAVRLICCAERHYPGGARNLGVARARGDLIGFIDADCIAAPNWVARVIEAHDGEHPVIGGVVGIAGARGRLDWAAYFCSFHRWMSGTPSGPMADIPACCLSYRRSVLDRFGPFGSHGFSSDTELNWRVAGAGHPLRLDATIHVSHIHHPTWRSFVRRQYTRGHAFARMRVAVQRFSPMRRLLYAGGSIVLPVLLSLRLARRVWGRRSRVPGGDLAGTYRRALVRAAPLVFLGFAFWAGGELVGYVRGGGRADGG